MQTIFICSSTGAARGVAATTGMLSSAWTNLIFHSSFFPSRYLWLNEPNSPRIQCSEMNTITKLHQDDVNVKENTEINNLKHAKIDTI